MSSSFCVLRQYRSLFQLPTFLQWLLGDIFVKDVFYSFQRPSCCLFFFPKGHTFLFLCNLPFCCWNVDILKTYHCILRFWFPLLYLFLPTVCLLLGAGIFYAVFWILTFWILWRISHKKQFSVSLSSLCQGSEVSKNSLPLFWANELINSSTSHHTDLLYRKK